MFYVSWKCLTGELTDELSKAKGGQPAYFVLRMILYTSTIHFQVSGFKWDLVLKTRTQASFLLKNELTLTQTPLSSFLCLCFGVFSELFQAPNKDKGNSHVHIT